MLVGFLLPSNLPLPNQQDMLAREFLLQLSQQLLLDLVEFAHEAQRQEEHNRSLAVSNFNLNENKHFKKSTSK